MQNECFRFKNKIGNVCCSKKIDKKFQLLIIVQTSLEPDQFN